MFQPGCPAGMASLNRVMAQRGAQLHPLVLAPLWQDWLLKSPLTGAHLCVCTAPCTRQCERLCIHIPQRPRPVQRQPSLGMTWIHFKSAVIHPGLAPGLPAHLPVVLLAPQPLSCGHSWVLGLPGAACSPSLPCCPWSQALPAPSPRWSVLAQSAVGPHRLFQQPTGWFLGAGVMLPQHPWHSQPCTGSPCHSLGPSIGPGTGDGSVLATTAPECTMGSSSLDQSCQPPHHAATEETCPGHPTPP